MWYIRAVVRVGLLSGVLWHALSFTAAAMQNLLMLALAAILPLLTQDRVLLKVERSEITFLSEAPLERITATNTRSTGLLDATARSFAVRIPIIEFQGFNAPLQQEHFNENYLESRKFPNATFEGRIIEAVDLSIPGEHAVRAKGRFTIHGVETERVIPCRVIVTDQGVRVTAEFEVTLGDHGIRIPRVVQQKLAAVALVKVDAVFKP